MLNQGEGSKTEGNRACLNAEAGWKERDEWEFVGAVEGGRANIQPPHHQQISIRKQQKEDITPIQFEPLLD